MKSALYRGRVQHTRLVPKRHTFRYGIHMFLLDLDELASVFRGRWLYSVERANLVAFRRKDFLGAPEVPLREAVLDRVEQELGRRPAGRVRLLTQLATLGYSFNPVSFYYCYEADGALGAIVAEITNTPWGERHAYVLDATQDEELVFRFDKDFHVSPFFDLDQVYEWRFSQPGEQLSVSMTNYEEGRPVFHAGLACERRPLHGRSLAGVLLRYPLQPLVLHAAIYFQAALLYLKRTPFFAHPKKRASLSDATAS